MSLFPSAFDTTQSAGPSTQLTQSKNQKSQKRKRPTSLNASTKTDQIRSTQINLDKLISKVEKGHVKEKLSGSESMGNSGGGGKRPAQGEHHEGHGRAEYHRPLGKKARHSIPGIGTDSVHPSRVAQMTSSPSMNHPKTVEKEMSGKGKSATGSSNQNSKRPAPAELPLPHDLPISQLSTNSEGDEKLTNLQKGMKAKLEGARFRWINEQLYSTPSKEAVEMMKKDPKIFADYHQTHRALTSSWPSPPLPYLLNLLRPLPPKTLIVDLGCGDAGLARALVPEGKIVLSYDLVGDSGIPSSEIPTITKNMGGGWVVEADFLECVPLPGRPGGLATLISSGGDTGEKVGKKKGKGKKDINDGTNGGSEIVDVVVCCLSLMGINWVGGIYEACRILKQGGIFHIAEVTSRFISIDEFINKIESFGFNLENQNSPSTHFTLFTFTKTSAVPLGPVRGQKEWQKRVEEGEQILRGCVYKKR